MADYKRFAHSAPLKLKTCIGTQDVGLQVLAEFGWLGRTGRGARARGAFCGPTWRTVSGCLILAANSPRGAKTLAAHARRRAAR